MMGTMDVASTLEGVIGDGASASGDECYLVVTKVVVLAARMLVVEGSGLIDGSCGGGGR